MTLFVYRIEFGEVVYHVLAPCQKQAVSLLKNHDSMWDTDWTAPDKIERVTAPCDATVQDEQDGEIVDVPLFEYVKRFTDPEVICCSEWLV